MADLGVGWYRFSIAWPRVQPDGRGAINEAGIDFYARLSTRCSRRTSRPGSRSTTGTSRRCCEDAGGWPERDTAERFAEYAVAVYERLHDRVTHWTTLNEPWCSALPRLRERAPTRRADPGPRGGDLRAAHHLMLGPRARDDGDARRRATRTPCSASRST